MPSTRAIAKGRHQISREIPRRQTMLHEMQYHIVEQSRHHIIALITVDSQPPSLIAEQWGIEEKELAYGGLVTVVNAGEKIR
jgi:hypothetical protein